jgi:putative ABC transport system permease protein
MIRHLLRLTWNRRRTNLLLMIEIFAGFLALMGLFTLGYWGWRAYHEPRGFSIEDVWRIRIQRGFILPDLPKQSGLGSLSMSPGLAPLTPAPEGPAPDTRQLLAALSALPPVVGAAATAGGAPYVGWRASRYASIHDRRYQRAAASDNLPVVLSIPLARGRWFGPVDRGSPDLPVVITEQMARAHFGDGDPIGRTLRDDPQPGQPPPPTMRVVGLVSRYLPRDALKGDYEPRSDFLFRPLTAADDGSDEFRAPTLLIKVQPGTPASFEQTVSRTVQALARGYEVEVTPYQLGERRKLNQALTFFAALAVLAGFLLLMVVLGLSGVVWQNVTQRTSEIGLRRAQGATAGDIRRQFLGELFAMATLSIAAGLVVVLHFAGIISHLSYFAVGWLPWQVYAVGFAFSALSIYVLVLMAGFLPAQMATRIQPLTALRQE